MNIVKKIINVMITKVKKTNYNCSPYDYYKPQKYLKDIK